MTGPSFPEGEDLRRHIGRRRRRGGYLKVAFLAALMVAIVALGTLLYTVINSSFGLVAIENEIDPASLVVASGYDADRSMEDLTKGELVAVLEANPKARAFWLREGFVPEQYFPASPDDPLGHARCRMTRDLD